MRLAIIAWCLVLTGGISIAGGTIWNVQATTSDGTSKLTTIGGNPNEALSPCRCVAGIFKLSKESSTHFSGTLESLSFNYARKAKKGEKLSVKIRKTRAVMGVHGDYRAALHGIMRGSGQL